MSKSWWKSKGAVGGVVLILIGLIELVPIVMGGEWTQLPEALATIALGLSALGIRLAIPGGG
jgi:hypothetical protein